MADEPKKSTDDLADFRFDDYMNHTAGHGNRYGGYGETEWDDEFANATDWVDDDEFEACLRSEEKGDNALSPDEQATLAAYSEMYKSRDGRLTVFTNADGHVVCVQTRHLA